MFGALAVSVLRFRDLPQRVARLDDVEFRYRFGFRHDDVVFDLRHSLGVSDSENDLFGLGRRCSRAAQGYLAAVDFDIDRGRLEAVLGDLFLQFFSGCGRRVGRACGGGVRLCSCRSKNPIGLFCSPHQTSSKLGRRGSRRPNIMSEHPHIGAHAMIADRFRQQLCVPCFIGPTNRSVTHFIGWVSPPGSRSS